MQCVNRVLFIVILVLGSLSTVVAQSAKKLSEKYYKDGNFSLALSYLNKIPNIENDKQLLAKKGICLFETNQLIAGSKDLTKAYEMGNNNPKLKYFMGRINHSMLNYEDAIFFYKTYLKEEKGSSALDAEVAMLIKNCFVGLRHQYEAIDIGLVENTGEFVNTADDELNPVPSPNFPNRYYFSSNLAQENYDLFSAEMNEGSWQRSNQIHESLNTQENEILQDCSQDGSVLVFLRGKEEDSNSLYLNRFSASRNIQRIISSEARTGFGDQDVYLVNDETMIFSSNRSEGYGGYDLYISYFGPNGWSKAKNLGPEINTSSNERYPFLIESETKLFFSSDKLGGLGGYDIYGATKETDKWGSIEIFSYPLNSPEDDIQFRIQEEGFQAYFSSNRKAKGFGGFDIYSVFLRQAYQIHDTKIKQPLALIRSSIKDEKYDSIVEEPIETQSNEKETEPNISDKPESPEDDFIVAKREPEIEKSKEPVPAEVIEEPIVEIKKEEAPKTEPQKTEEVVTTVFEEKEEPMVGAKEEPMVADKEEPAEIIELEGSDPVVLGTTEPQKDEPQKVEISNSKTEEEIRSTEIQPKSIEISKDNQKPKKTKKGEDIATTTEETKSEIPIVVKTENKEEGNTGKKKSNANTSIKLEPIYYTSNDDVISEVNKEKIQTIYEILEISNSSEVMFTCHSLPEGLPEFELMFSIRRAEQIAEELAAMGIAKNRIQIKGLGSNYPFVRKSVDDKLFAENKKFNNRIDIRIMNSEIPVEMEQPVVDSKILNPAYSLYNTVTEDVYFRVFVHETEKKLFKNAILRYYNDLLIEKGMEESMYEYYVGLYPDFKRAFELKRELENRNIQSAKIVAFFNGIQLSIADAQLLKSSYSELVNFLEISQ